MKLIWVVVFILSAQIGKAQTDGPPNEPPYTTLDNEFDKAAKTPGETVQLQAGESALPPIVPVPPDVVEAPKPTAPAVEVEEHAISQKGTYLGRKVIVDPETHKKYIHHPGAAQGLTLIDADGVYYYNPAMTATKDQTSTFRVGSVNPPPGISSADQKTNFSKMYGDYPTTIVYDYEWKPLQGYGDLGVQTGFGFLTAQGQGHFDCSGAGCPTGPAKEKYTFYALPLNLGAIYRFQYIDQQWVAPYVSGGLSYFVLGEVRDDGKTHFVGTPTFYGAGGLLFNISALDRETGFSMDSEYGLKTLWLSAEIRQIQATSNDLNMSGTVYSLGVAADY